MNDDNYSLDNYSDLSPLSSISSPYSPIKRRNRDYGIQTENIIYDLESTGSGIIPEYDESETSSHSSILNSVVTSNTYSTTIQDLLQYITNSRKKYKITLLLVLLIIGSFIYGFFIENFKKNINTISPNFESLFFMMISKYPNCKDLRLQIWRYFSPILVHSGINHLISNLVFFIPTSISIEKRQTTLSLILIYIIGTFNSSAISYIFKPYYASLGSSGLVYTSIGSFLSDFIFNNRFYFYYYDFEIYFSIIILYTILISIDVLHYFFYFNENISYGSHWIGFLTGLFGGFFLFKKILFEERSNYKIITEYIARIIGLVFIFFTTYYIIYSLSNNFPLMKSYNYKFEEEKIENCCFEYFNWKQNNFSYFLNKKDNFECNKIEKSSISY